MIILLRTLGSLRFPHEQLPVWVGAVFVLVLIAGGIYAWWGSSKTSGSKWEDGMFPADFPFNRDHLMEAYIAAAAILVAKDRYRMTGKLTFINGYLQWEFSDVYYDFNESYRHSLRHPVSIKSTAAWLNRHLKTDSEKEQLLLFLFDLSWYDGELNDAEYAALQLMTRLLGLQWEPYEQKIRERDRNRSKVSHQETNSNELYFNVLELKSESSEADIKTTYRQLVKIYHPDKYMQEAPEVRERAAAKFREIQEAYEHLTATA